MSQIRNKDMKPVAMLRKTFFDYRFHHRVNVKSLLKNGHSSATIQNCHFH